MNSVRNILAIADKELRSYFASPIAYIIIGLFALLFGWFFYVYLMVFVQRSPAMMQLRRRRRQQHQPDDDPLRPDERRGHHPVRDADDHDADLLGRKALRHHRAAADVAADRPARSSSASSSARWASTRAMLLVTMLYMAILFVYGNPGMAADRGRVPGAAADGRLLHLGRPADLEPDEEPDRRRLPHVRGVPDAVDHQLARRISPGR